MGPTLSASVSSPFEAYVTNQNYRLVVAMIISWYFAWYCTQHLRETWQSIILSEFDGAKNIDGAKRIWFKEVLNINELQYFTHAKHIAKIKAMQVDLIRKEPRSFWSYIYDPDSKPRIEVTTHPLHQKKLDRFFAASFS